MRLIDADALKEHKFVDTNDNYRIGWNNALDAVENNEPTVEAVPVIRCKDCKYYVIHTLFGRSQGWCERLCDEFDRSLARGTEPDDYCSRAERKEK